MTTTSTVNPAQIIVSTAAFFTELSESHAVKVVFKDAFINPNQDEKPD